MDSTVLRKTRLACVSCIVTSLLASNVQAYNGNQLLSGLSSMDRPDSETFIAMGVLQGTYATLREVGFAGMCINFPVGISNGQIVDIVKRYLQQNPEKRHEPSTLHIMMASIEAFGTRDAPTNGHCGSAY